MDKILLFVGEKFGNFEVRERQVSKIRLEIPSEVSDGVKRPISSLFGEIELKKEELSIQDYSISQTSLEQIFNSFAAKQEEETGAAVGIRR
jgi:hypothetical protein